MLSKRSSGILLHPTSLPGPFGSGDFGSASFQFVDWLSKAGQTLWQMLPLSEVGSGNSPYMSSSAFAGSLLLIDLEELAKQGWLTVEDLQPLSSFSAERVDYGLVKPFRVERLHLASGRFFAKADKNSRAAYAEFCKQEASWLDDYALFMTIGEQEHWKEWSAWPQPLANRDPKSLAVFEKANSEEIGFWKFCQWSFSRQWFALKKYANERGVNIVGDVPIFVAYQSADVWAHQDLFELDDDGRPTLVAGVPPDYFSETGQLWGNPLYRWDMHEKSGYAWWIERMKHALHYFDLVRVDHFRGFANYWAVPASAKTAIEGQWMPGPGDKLFEAFKQAIGHLPIIAEDLGLITSDVIELRDRFELPGMRILQFAFGEDERNYFLPHHYVANCVAYTGTHDNDTSVGWWNTAKEHEKSFAQHYLNFDGNEINWQMINLLSASAANTVIYPLQDIIGLSSEHRMNMPGTSLGNWAWRFSWNQLQPWHADRLAELSLRHSRK